MAGVGVWWGGGVQPWGGMGSPVGGGMEAMVNLFLFGIGLAVGVYVGWMLWDSD